MTDRKLEDEEIPEGALEDDKEMQKLLASAMSDVGAPQPDLVKRVQTTIRKRSKGRFFSDGWSTANTRANYLVIALTMLLIAGVSYFVLHPSGFQ